MTANARALRGRAKQIAGPRLTVLARCVLRSMPVPRWGNLRRTRPFSENFGFDRGSPVDRYYVARFLDRHRDDIHGDALEIQETGYTRQFGRDLRDVHSLDINPRFAPTYLCDLAHCDGIVPSARYDCFLLPNTVCFLRELDACLRQALRIVKPGGVILATAPTMVPLIPDGPDYWRLTADGWREVAARVWPGCEISIESHGNCLAAVAAMYGIAHEELSPQELDVNDRRYPVLVTMRCRKPETTA